MLDGEETVRPFAGRKRDSMLDGWETKVCGKLR